MVGFVVIHAGGMHGAGKDADAERELHSGPPSPQCRAECLDVCDPQQVGVQISWHMHIHSLRV